MKVNKTRNSLLSTSFKSRKQKFELVIIPGKRKNSMQDIYDEMTDNEPQPFCPWLFPTPISNDLKILYLQENGFFPYHSSYRRRCFHMR